MALEPAIEAIRSSVALRPAGELVCLEFSGPLAFETVDRLCPIELYLRHGQMQHTLLLDDDALPVADLYVACHEEDFIFLAEEREPGAIMSHLRSHLPAARGAEVKDLRATHGVLALDGPFAWELLGAVVGPEIIGLPYLTFARLDSLSCFRGGKTGEFGYYLMAPLAEIGELEARLVEAGGPFDLGRSDLAAVEQCSLENFFFNIRREGRSKATPLELQLQWRISHHKDFVGSEALKRRRERGIEHRLTCLTSREEVGADDPVFAGPDLAGRVVNAGFSFTRGEWVALALLDLRHAYPGLDLACGGEPGLPHPVRTVTPPVINNRSLHVSPQAHAYATRSEIRFPPLVV